MAVKSEPNKEVRAKKPPVPRDERQGWQSWCGGWVT
jgi:hypothetical protein